MVQRAKAVVDKFMSRFVSKKLTVWLTATGLAFVGMLTSGDWVTISMVYIGSQAAVDLVVALKQHGN
tara:strand:- start:27827 stop:28027 length:201 start_codon:yes stop_codon:yes gene_type:complete